MTEPKKRGFFSRLFEPEPVRPEPSRPEPAEPVPTDPAPPLPPVTTAPQPVTVPTPEAPMAPSPAVPALAGDAVGAAPAPRVTWFDRMRQGLSRSSQSLTSEIGGLFTKARLDDETLDSLEDILIAADLGIETATRVVESVSTKRYQRDLTPDDVKAILADEVAQVLAPVARPLEIGSGKPHVVLVIGVNGSGKTTTIGKLAAKFRAEGRRVMLAAGDTFRAAAVEQLGIWGERTGATVVSRPTGSDAAGLVFEAFERARGEGADVLMVDTAGRLQNRVELMAELEKIVRVMKKIDPAAPHSVLLVLDATVGQNALSQVELFARTAGVTGLVMTKLDGTARGGILAAIAAKHRLPVHFIGVGEGIEDLEPFDAREFGRAMVGLG